MWKCNRIKSNFFALTLSSLVFVSWRADAATATGNLNVGTTVPSMCNVSVPSPLTFTIPSSGLASAILSNATVNVLCSQNAVYTVSLGTGNGPNATCSGRFMTANIPAANGSQATTATIGYSLYQDSTNTKPWCNTAGNMYTGTGNGIQQSLTVYGQIPAATGAAMYPAPGVYSDVVSVTVTTGT